MAGTETGTGGFKKGNLVILGAVTGFLYGFGLRILANSSSSHLAVMTMGFTCFMPFAMGCVTVYFAEIGQPRRVWNSSPKNKRPSCAWPPRFASACFRSPA